VAASKPLKIIWCWEILFWSKYLLNSLSIKNNLSYKKQMKVYGKLNKKAHLYNTCDIFSRKLFHMDISNERNNVNLLEAIQPILHKVKKINKYIFWVFNYEVFFGCTSMTYLFYFHSFCNEYTGGIPVVRVWYTNQKNAKLFPFSFIRFFFLFIGRFVFVICL
jgi:hypothetical protein